MVKTKFVNAAIGLAAVAALSVGATAYANAAAPGAAGTSTTTTTAAADTAQPPAGPAPHEHTAVTGDELAKVKAAVKAKDSAVTVTEVRKDPDGSYDVLGTKAGAPVMLEVTADLKTITTREGRGRGPGGPGGHVHTPVTGDELAKVTAAVKAKDSSVTVEKVAKDEDGSYDVFGTKAGARVMLEVSKDLKTITERQAPEGGRGPGHDQTQSQGDAA